MFNEHTFLLDVSKKPISSKPPIIVLGQGDHNAYTLNVQLFDNSQPLDVDNYTVWFEMLLPDKQTTYAQEAQTQPGNTAVIVIDEEKAAAVVGTTKVASIVVRDAQGALIASTDRLTVECLRSPRSGKPAESWISGIDETIAAMESATESANEAAEAADTAREQAEQAAEDIQAQVTQQAQDFNAAQTQRATEFSAAQTQRANEFSAAQTARNDAFTQAQTQRAEAYQQAEANRETEYQTAESGRDQRADAALQEIIDEIDQHAGKYIPLMASDKLGGAKLGGSVQTVEQALEIKLVDSASGESVTAESASYLNSLSVYGKSVQDGTPTPDNPVPVQVVGGKNLYNLNAGTNAGVTMTKDPDGAYVFNGTSTGFATFEFTEEFPTGAYTMSVKGDAIGTPSNTMFVRTRDANNNIRHQISMATAQNWESIKNNNPIAKCSVNVPAGLTFNNYKLYVQLERGTVATPYTPYGCIGLQTGETVTPIDLQGHTLASSDILRVDSSGHVTIEVNAKKLSGYEFDVGSVNLLSDDTVSFSVVWNDTVTGSVAYSNVAYVNGPNTGKIVVFGNVVYMRLSQSVVGTTGAEIAEWLAQNAVLYYTTINPQTIELGTITPPTIPSGATIEISASLTPTIEASWWTEKAAPIPEALKSYADAYTPTLVNTDASIAPIEQSVATANHNVGELLMVDGVLYRVTVAIATGETIASGTNVTPTTLAAVIAEMSNN